MCKIHGAFFTRNIHQKNNDIFIRIFIVCLVLLIIRVALSNDILILYNYIQDGGLCHTYL